MKSPPRPTPLWLSGALALAGAGATAAGLLGPDAAGTWRTVLVNFLFWTGLASGAVLLSAVLTLADARWAGPLRRLSEAFAAFLPLSCLVFAGLWWGQGHLHGALTDLPPARRLWLSPAFLYGRDGAALALLAVSAAALARAGLRGSRRPQGLATAYAVLFSVVLSLLAFDWVMFLDPHWMSTLFGAYFFVGSFYTGLAALAVTAGLSSRGFRLRPEQSHDLGNLCLGFAFTVGYLFFVQFLVSWYGNLPVETRFLILRLRGAPWSWLGRAVLGAAFVVPVTVLLFRRAKARPPMVAAAGACALGGMWLERFVLVAPTLAPAGRLSLGVTDALITAGFLGLTALPVLAYLRRFPPEPEARP